MTAPQRSNSDPSISSAANDAQLIDFEYEPVAVDNTKAARGEGWSERANTVEAIAAERVACPDARSTGLRTGRTVGVDIDLRNEHHVAEIETLAEKMLGTTGFVRFGSKGAMLVYRNETPIKKITVSTDEGVAVEILGKGQQFVAYGKHPSGKLYRWKHADLSLDPLGAPLGAVPEVTPERLRDFARACVELVTRLGYVGVRVSGDMGKKATPREAPANVELDSDHAVAQFRSFIKSDCKQHGQPVDGAGSDPRAYAIINKGMDLGLSDEKIGDLLEEHWAPDFTRGWLDTKIANADKYRQNERGSDAPRSAEEAFGPAIEKLRAEGRLREPANDNEPPVSKWPKPTSYSDVIARTAPPVRELIAGLLQMGKANFLSAPGGSHKSRLLQQWGLCLDAGAKVWDRATERAQFVCLSYEDDSDEITRRAQTITRRLNLPANSTGELWDLQGCDLPLAIVTEAGDAELTDFGKHVREHLRSTPGHKFVGIDSCYNALRFVGNAKINEGAVMAAIGSLDLICKECDCTMLVLWHPSQAGQERGDASGWSVAWHNAPRARLSLSPVRDNEDAYDLKVEKRNYAKAKGTLTLHFADGVLLPRTSIDETQLAGRLADACVQVATEAAATGKPIQDQRKVAKVWYDRIAACVGYKPTDRAIKDELDRASARGLLVYKRNRNGHGGAAGYYPAPVTGPFVDRIRVLARWFARWGVDYASVNRLHKADVLLPTDPGTTTLATLEGQQLTDEQLRGLETFARQFAQAVDADAFGEAGVRPNKRQAHPDYGLRPLLLAATAQAHREAPTTGTVPDKVEGEL